MHGSGARCLAQAITFKDDAFSDWCGQRMVQDARKADGFFREWKATPFHPFMARLYARWREPEADVNTEALNGLGVYQPLFDGWNNEAHVASSLLQICNYHCERRFSTEQEDTEFWHSPFQVFPAEILAIRRVRQEQVGVVPVVNHPLLDTPLGQVPSSVLLSNDELLSRVITKIKSELPPSAL
jgi:hypothetical protein